jgi:hypothetical protein
MLHIMRPEILAYAAPWHTILECTNSAAGLPFITFASGAMGVGIDAAHPTPRSKLGGTADFFYLSLIRQ